MMNHKLDALIPKTIRNPYWVCSLNAISVDHTMHYHDSMSQQSSICTCVPRKHIHGCMYVCTEGEKERTRELNYHRLDPWQRRSIVSQYRMPESRADRWWPWPWPRSPASYRFLLWKLINCSSGIGKGKESICGDDQWWCCAVTLCPVNASDWLTTHFLFL